MNQITRREWLGTTAGWLAYGAPVLRSFLLFDLLKPQEVIVRPIGTARLHCASGSRQWVVDGDERVRTTVADGPIQINGPGGMAVWSEVAIPDCLKRVFYGGLTLRSGPDSVWITLTTELEIAVNSITGAELPAARAAPDALAAQAIVSRSVLLSTPRPRHTCAQFCDTTHCQFFRSPSSSGSPVAEAVAHTRGMVMVAREPFAPRYSAACGGVTEAGYNTGFFYSKVTCDYCMRKGLARRGHGWGMCQEGAMALARDGASFREILATYYPGVSILAS